METLPDTQLRASSAEREQTISRLQEAYIRGQLSEKELAERIDRALTAVVKADLGQLVADLPALMPEVPVPAVRTPWWKRHKDESVYKATLRKSGPWTVPPVFRTNVYKGMLIIDLRHALLTSAQTVIELNAFKSRVAIVVPVEYRVELESKAYKGTMENLTDGGRPGGAYLLIRGSAYKSSVVVTSQEPGQTTPTET